MKKKSIFSFGKGKFTSSLPKKNPELFCGGIKTALHRQEVEKAITKKKELTMCQAATDGDCIHPDCPQNRDGEPYKTGRHCPLPHWTEDENY